MTTPSDPDQIRREIERTQSNLSNDVDALTDKVSPGRIVERRVNRVRGTASRWKEKVMGSSEPNSAYDPAYGGGAYDPYDGGGYDSPAYGRTYPGRGEGSPGGVQDRAQLAAGAISDTASSAASSVSGAASSAAGAVQDAPRAIRQQTQGNPLAAGLIAFGAGWLISSLLPASQREQELTVQAKDRASEVGQPLAEAAKQAAAEVKDNLTEPAQQAVQSVRSTATDAGQTVAEESRSAAGHVQGQAQDSAGAVRQNPGSGPG